MVRISVGDADAEADADADADADAEADADADADADAEAEVVRGSVARLSGRSAASTLEITGRTTRTMRAEG
ncbi:MAG TPA: hypothetical protein VH328_16945 [Burkholderiaceae bacterium]|nr:hypothetical protein [Burkholderiaceae bacterium]